MRHKNQGTGFWVDRGFQDDMASKRVDSTVASLMKRFPPSSSPSWSGSRILGALISNSRADNASPSFGCPGIVSLLVLKVTMGFDPRRR